MCQRIKNSAYPANLLLISDMKTVAEIKNILIQYKEQLRQKYNVKDIAIFGSYVTDKAEEQSDVDILVEFETPIGLFDFLDLEESLGQMLEVKVDLVSKKALKPHIGECILKEAIYL